MSDFKISELMKFQHELYERHKAAWTPRTPEYGKDSILWSIDEMGEVIAIIKKKGEEDIMNNPAVRRHYVEECCDVLMYWFDMLECFDISAEELCGEFEKKFNKNMNRSWVENESMYED